MTTKDVDRPTREDVGKVDERFGELERQALSHSERIQDMFAHRAEMYKERREELEQHLEELDKADSDTINKLQSRINELWRDIREDLEGLETLFRSDDESGQS